MNLLSASYMAESPTGESRGNEFQESGTVAALAAKLPDNPFVTGQLNAANGH